MRKFDGGSAQVGRELVELLREIAMTRRRIFGGRVNQPFHGKRKAGCPVECRPIIEHHTRQGAAERTVLMQGLLHHLPLRRRGLQGPLVCPHDGFAHDGI
ncbi:MAG: hypothetical protein KBE25_01385 [Laribacter sp.]|nr:hypothetical protein [Laribacter sp.]MBP9607994.1 hypothetical protein [Laribacter sp.]